MECSCEYNCEHYCSWCSDKIFKTCNIDYTGPHFPFNADHQIYSYPQKYGEPVCLDCGPKLKELSECFEELGFEIKEIDFDLKIFIVVNKTVFILPLNVVQAIGNGYLKLKHNGDESYLPLFSDY